MLHQDRYDEIGTTAAPVTLTSAFSGNQGTHKLSRYYKKLHIGGAYTPATTNAYLEIKLEISNDPTYGAAPTNWEQMTVQVAATSEIDVYVDGGTGMGASPGIPIIIPGDKTSTIAVAYPINYDLDDLNANWVRCAVQEVGGTSAGTCNVYFSLVNL